MFIATSSEQNISVHADLNTEDAFARQARKILYLCFHGSKLTDYAEVCIAYQVLHHIAKIVGMKQLRAFANNGMRYMSRSTWADCRT